MIESSLRDEINKRLTLNWLIQGASQHAGQTLHHLVRDELCALDDRLLRLYDQFALVNILQWWHADAAMIVGRPARFWRRAASSAKHPFFGHTLLARHGGMLAEAAKRRALERCREKRVTTLPILFSIQAMLLMSRLRLRESPHRLELIGLARKAAAMVWGVPVERLEADLTPYVARIGNLSTPRSVRGAILRAAAVGYGGVMRRGDSLCVVATAANWQLLAKELVKGTAELICLHGLNRLTDDAYLRVMWAADRLEYEPWMLQSGGELWRRLLALLPTGRPVAEVLMHLARLPPHSLESLMLAVIERPEWAPELLAALGE
jgi:hypothetical protein